MARISRDYLSKAAPVEPLFHAGRMIARITCAECGCKDEWTIAQSKPPPEILGKHFTTKGWFVRKRPICPNCSVSAHPVKSLKRTCEDAEPPHTSGLQDASNPALPRIEKEKPTMTNVAPIKTEQAPTEAVKAARRKANELLMFQFDVEKGRYEDGWSDERVAKESGMPVAWVVKRRDEEYGPLKEPGEFAELRKEIAAAAATLTALQNKLADMARRNGWQT